LPSEVRGGSHVGAEVNPNHADAEAVLLMASWLMAELVQIFHNVTLIEAQEAVDSLVERRHPLVWEVEDKKRVLDNTHSATLSNPAGHRLPWPVP
jgi:hypothetical protein